MTTPARARLEQALADSHRDGTSLLVTRLALSAGEPAGAQLVLELAIMAGGQEVRRLTLRCDGVRDLSLRGWGGGATCLSSLAVDDITHWQWEWVRYEVSDYEDSQIHFYCWDVEIVSHEEGSSAV